MQGFRYVLFLSSALASILNVLVRVVIYCVFIPGCNHRWSVDDLSKYNFLSVRSTQAGKWTRRKMSLICDEKMRQGSALLALALANTCVSLAAFNCSDPSPLLPSPASTLGASYLCQPMPPPPHTPLPVQLRRWDCCEWRGQSSAQRW